MKEATIFGMFLAVVMGVMAITQVDTIRANLVAATSGTLSLFLQNLTFIWLLMAVAIAVVFVLGAASLSSRR
jgi:hypothetical protein